MVSTVFGYKVLLSNYYFFEFCSFVWRRRTAALSALDYALVVLDYALVVLALTLYRVEQDYAVARRSGDLAVRRLQAASAEDGHCTAAPRVVWHRHRSHNRERGAVVIAKR